MIPKLQQFRLKGKFERALGKKAPQLNAASNIVSELGIAVRGDV